MSVICHISRACSPKRRRLSGDVPVEDPKSLWPQPSSSIPALASVDPTQGLPETDLRSQCMGQAVPGTSSPLPGATDTDGSCMEVEAAQRRLQEIEDRSGLLLCVLFYV